MIAFAIVLLLWSLVVLLKVLIERRKIRELSLDKKAVDESILIWRIVASHGVDKWVAIRYLFKEGRISKEDYNFNCPLCTRGIEANRNCSKCPWTLKPGKPCYDTGPFVKYIDALEKYGAASKEASDAAWEVVLLLQAIEFK